jgi:hypothetical protein
MGLCKDCKLYPVEKVKDKAGRIHKNRAARCQWVSAEVYPSSIQLFPRPQVNYMQPNDGVDCQCFISRKQNDPS